MKKFVVTAVSIVLVTIFFCPMILAAPDSMPSDLQIVQPDPSLPKELSAFFGKWEGADNFMHFFLIVEKIDNEKASLYFWRSGYADVARGWSRIDGNVTKEGRKYKLWYSGRTGPTQLILKGEYLDMSTYQAAGPVTIRFTQVK